MACGRLRWLQYAYRRGLTDVPRVIRPTAADLQAATGRTIRDVIAPGLDVLFCGINPGLYSAATGFHFARPGNRFWPALASAAFTSTKLEPGQWRELLARRIGITNLVARATASADELRDDELRAGRKRLETKVRRYRPRAVAIVGLGVYRTAFERPAARIGRQPEDMAGALVWVLPNTSGLNAHYQAADFTRTFAELRRALLQGTSQ